MINYDDPSRWTIVQYRPGTGGKFLCAALMTIGRIAHWDFRVETNQISYQDWITEQWRYQEYFEWIAYEPLHKWDTRFFSRTFARGEDLDRYQYNSLMLDSASDYFKSVWDSGKIVLDFVNKSHMPVWWRESCIVRLDAQPNCPVHRQFLLSKIYPFNEHSKIGMFMMDHPLPENPSPNARIYQNQYKFGPFDSQDDWYKYIWNNDFRLNFKMPRPDMLLTDLSDFDLLEQKIQKISCDLDSNYSKDDLRFAWTTWMNKQEKILKCIDFKV